MHNFIQSWSSKPSPIKGKKKEKALLLHIIMAVFHPKSTQIHIPDMNVSYASELGGD